MTRDWICSQPGCGLMHSEHEGREHEAQTGTNDPIPADHPGCAGRAEDMSLLDRLRTMHAVPVMREAADEIERLNGRLLHHAETVEMALRQRDDALCRLVKAKKALSDGAFQARRLIRNSKGPRDRAVALAFESFCKDQQAALTDEHQPRLHDVVTGENGSWRCKTCGALSDEQPQSFVEAKHERDSGWPGLSDEKGES